MSGRALLLILFLYTALGWVGTARFFPEKFIEYGLLWTAIGLVVALLAVIVQQSLGVWRVRRAQAGSKPPKPTPKPSVLSDEAAALDALRREAMARLSSSSGKAPMGGSAFSGRALFLVLGPSKSGKTQTLMNSGLDPRLLAGQVRGDSAVVPTRVANFWLAQEGIFVELSGRLYESDQERWISLLKVLCGDSGKPLWKRLWRDEQRPLLRGVLLFHDVQCAMAPPDSAPTGAQSRIAQERLQAVADVFGATVPVYAIFTKSDSVKFFGEYFGRLPQNEAAQAFGYTLAADQSAAPAQPMPWSETETRRLTKAFRTVYRHLAERRLLYLMREGDPSRKPDIYEFPREFRRIRGALVQMLTDTFKPDPLKPGPALRGFYFTGTRMAEAAIADPTVHGDQTFLGNQRIGREADYSEATHIFEPGVFKASGPAAPEPRGRGPLQQQWMFTRQLFLETIPNDLPPVVAAPAQPILEKYRVLITRSVAGLSLVMGLIWLLSYLENRELIQGAEVAIEKVERVESGTRAGSADLSYLEAFNELRKEIEALNDKRLGARWLLYTGDDVRETLERLYFHRLNALLLSQLNLRLAERLASLPGTPPELAEFDPVYRQLATHLAITTGGCEPVDTAVVGAVLKDEARDAKLTESPKRKQLIEALLDFYARTLRRGNPLPQPGNDLARNRAREYLKNVKSDDRIYQEIKKIASQKLPRQGNVRLEDFAGDTSKVLTGPLEMPAVFTPDGWTTFEKEANDAPKVKSGDCSVLGPTGGILADRRGSGELIRAVRTRYVKEYKKLWMQFIEQQKFEQYRGLEDAVNKLELLSGPKSPVLGLIAFASKNTSFPQEQAQISFPEKVKEKFGSLAKEGGKSVEKPIAQSDPEDSPVRISKAFQPVHGVVAPDAQNWVGEKNAGYVTALAELRQRLIEIRRSSGTTDPAVDQQATQAADKAMAAVHQIAMGFTSTGSEGLDSTVKNLLEAPILAARRFIDDNPEKAQAARLTGELKKFCAIATPILKKYPFSPLVRTDDASPQDVASLFAPGTGAFSKLQPSLSDLVTRQGSLWVPKAEGQKLRPYQELLPFLNKIQTLTDTLYPNKTAQLGLQYNLRPVEGSVKGFSVTLQFDGKTVEFTEGSPFQKPFTWPAALGDTPGAKAWISFGGADTYFGSGDGLWGVFRVFGDADRRDLGSRQVKWSDHQVAGGGRVPLPKPVRLEFVGPQGAADLLNPKFFEGLSCPKRAVQ